MSWRAAQMIADFGIPAATAITATATTVAVKNRKKRTPAKMVRRLTDDDIMEMRAKK